MSNLLNNGDFESPDGVFDGWAWGGLAHNGGSTGVPGTVDLQPKIYSYVADSSLMQSFATVIGTSYTVSFDFPVIYANSSTDRLTVSILGGPSQTYAPIVGSYSFTFTAISLTTTLMFDNPSLSHFYIDNVFAGLSNADPTGVPVLSGTETEGQVLSVDPSAIQDADGLGVFSQQWERWDATTSSWVAIPGATDTTYQLTEADAGTAVRAVTSYTDGGGTQESVASAQTASIVALPRVASATISGSTGLVNGEANAGDTVTIAVQMNKPVTLTGQILLHLSNGETVGTTSVSGSNNDTLTFSYTVVAGDDDADLTVTSLSLTSGSTLEDSDGDAAVLSDFTPLSLSLPVDTVAPFVPALGGLVYSTDTGVSDTDCITSNTTPTVFGGAESGNTVTLYDTDGTTVLGTGVGDIDNHFTIAITSALSEGTHHLRATTTDDAGNVSDLSDQLVVTIDTAAPAVPSGVAMTAASDTGTSHTDRLTSNTTPTFTGHADPGSIVTLRDTAVSPTAVLGTAAVGADGTWSITSAPLSDGTHELSTFASDMAGNASTPSANMSIAIDTQAPQWSMVSGLAMASDSGVLGDGITSATTPLIRGHAEAGSAVVLYDTDGVTVLGTATADFMDTWAITTPHLADGVHQLRVTATDAAGNISPLSAPTAITVDTTAPAAAAQLALAPGSDTGFSSTDNLTNDTVPTVTGTAEVGSTVTLYDTDGTTVLGTGTTGSNGSWSVTSSTLAGGAHTLRAKVTDPAGNVSGFSAPLSITLDTTAPDAPTLSLSSASDWGISHTDRLTGDTTPVITGHGDPGSIITLTDTSTSPATVMGTGVVGADGTWSITSATLSDGGHMLVTTATDTAGNVSVPSAGLTVTIDTAVPPTPSLQMTAASDTGSSHSDGITADTTPTFQGNAATGDTVTLHDTNGTVLGTAVVGAQGTWEITSSVLRAGSHQITVTATNPSGVVSALSTPLTAVIDRFSAAPSGLSMAPDTDTGASDADGITSDSTPTIQGQAEAGSTVTLYDTDRVTVLGTGVAGQDGHWSIDSAVLSDGVHSVTAKAVDPAGNLSAASAALPVTIDTLPPPPPAGLALTAATDNGSSHTDGITTITTPTVTGTAAPGAAVTLLDTDGVTVLGTGTADAQGTWSIASSALALGSHTLSAVTEDVAGNVSDPGTLSVVIVAPPPAPGAVHMMSMSDTGASSTDNITAATTPIFFGTGVSGTTITLYDTDGTTVLGTSVVSVAGLWSIAAGTMVEGVHQVTARAGIGGVDSAPTASLAVTIDTTAPAAPLQLGLAAGSDSGTSNTDRITNVITPTVTGQAEAGSTVVLHDTDGVTVLGTAVAGQNGAWSIASQVLTDGLHELTAQATDLAGNVSVASAALAVTIDTAAPPTPSQFAVTAGSDSGVSHTDGITDVTTPAVAGLAAPGSTVVLYDTNGVTVLGTAVAGPNGDWSITTPALPDGVHSVTVQVTSPAGNVSPRSAPLALTIDTMAPAAPTQIGLPPGSDSGLSNTDRVTDVTTPVITGHAEAGSSVVLFDTDGVTVLGTAVAGQNGAWSIASQALADGVHALMAQATDLAGNVSVASAPLAVAIDTAAPAAPVQLGVDAGSDSGASSADRVTNVITPVITGHAEAGSSVVLFDTDGVTVLGTAVAGQNGAWSIASQALADGVHALTAQATDLAGNVSVASAPLAVAIDTAAPAAPVQLAVDAGSDSGASGADRVTNVITPVITGHAEAGSSVVLFDTDGVTVLGTAVAGQNGAWSIASQALADGVHALTARATDPAGNTSAPSLPMLVAIDTTAPGAPVQLAMDSGSDSGVLDADRLTRITTPVITGHAEASSTVVLFDTDGVTVLGTAIAGQNSAWSIASQGLADGVHALTAQATDLAGNVSVASAPLAVAIDTAAPAAPVQLAMDSGSDSGVSDADSLTSITTPVITGHAEAGSSVVLFDTDGVTVLGTSIAGQNGAWSIASQALADGVHALTARATDLAGNVSVASAPLAVAIDTAAPAAPVQLAVDAGSDSGASDADRLTNVITPVITGQAEVGSSVVLFDTDGVTVLGTATAGSNGAWSIASHTLAEGVHALTARATDPAGNTSAPSLPMLVAIDTTAPGTPVQLEVDWSSDSGSSSTDRVTNVTTPVITGHAEAGSSVVLFDTDGVTVLGTAVAGQSGAWSIASQALADGVHALTAQATDLAGNMSEMSMPIPVTIDTVAPDAPVQLGLSAGSDSGLSATDALTNVTTPTIDGRAETGSTVVLYDTNGMTILGVGTAGPAGTWSITSQALGDGVHELTARATDLAGNTSGASAALAVTVDTVAPDQPSVAGLAFMSDTGLLLDGTTSVTTPIITGQAEVGSTVVLHDTDGLTVLGTATAGPDGSWSIASRALADGAHALTAQATDPAGNTSAASAASLVTIDTVAPGAPVQLALAAGSDSGMSGSDRITGVAAPVLTGLAEAGSIVTLYDADGHPDTDGQLILGTGVADGTGRWAIAAPALADGVHTITARAMDAAGNVSAPSAGLAVTIDTTAPSAPVLLALAAGSDSGVSDSDRVTHATAPVVTGLAEAGSRITLFDTDGLTVLGTAATDGTGRWSVTSAALSDGVHVLSAQATDAAGNVSTASGGLAVTIDTVAPDAPVLLALAAGSDSGRSASDRLTGVTTPVLTGQAEAGSAVTLFDTDGQTVLGTGVADGTGHWSVTSSALADGLHLLSAQATDAAGNGSGLSTQLAVTIDATAPPAPVQLALAAGSDGGLSSIDRITPITTPVVTGQAEAGSGVTLFDTDGLMVLGTATADGAGHWSITSTRLADGMHGLMARATDAAGNLSVASAALTVTIDTTSPAAALVTGLAAGSDTGASQTDGLTSRTTPTLVGTAEAQSIVTVFDGATLLGTTVASAEGRWSLTPGAAFAQGSHAIAARATDAAGNAGSAGTPYAVTVDTTAPSPTLSLLDGRGRSDVGRIAPQALLHGTGEAGGGVTLLQNGTAVGTASVGQDGTWSFDASGLAASASSLAVSQTDGAGNTGVASLAANVLSLGAATGGGVSLGLRSDQVASLLQSGGTLHYAAGTDLIHLVDGDISVGTGTAEAFVSRLYQAELGRTAGTRELSYWTDKASGESREQLANEISNSQEYGAEHGTVSDADFVTGLYHTMLGRAADAGGQALWAGQLASGVSRGAVLAGFADSTEAQGHWAATTESGLFAADSDAALVRAAYQTVFGRDAETAGLEGWMAALKTSMSPADFANALTHSAEFQALHAGQSGSELVQSLYQGGLGRPAEAAAVTAWGPAIDAGQATAGSLVLAIASSNEAQWHTSWAL